MCELFLCLLGSLIEQNILGSCQCIRLSEVPVWCHGLSVVWRSAGCVDGMKAQTVVNSEREA